MPMRNIRNDLILILSLLLLIGLGTALYFGLREKEDIMVHIYYEKEKVAVLEINENREFEINQVIIVIENQEVYVKFSTCKDQICVHQGHISSSGQTITCLPQRVVVQLVGKGVDVGI